MSQNNQETVWSARTYVLVLFCQSVAITSANSLPERAIADGGFGNILCFIFFYLFIGLPLMYMELFVSQYTSKDCIDVWHIRRCFSHVGYIYILWQFAILMNNFIITSCSLHYLFVSLQQTIPFYTCGKWSDSVCDIGAKNYTINQKCFRGKYDAKFCSKLYKTLPEYQYFRYNMLNKHKPYEPAWSVCLASCMIAVLLFVVCFKGKRSIHYFIWILAFCPLLALFTFMFGGLIQKGVAEKFADAMDLEFRWFANKFRFSESLANVLYGLGIGSGLSFNLGAGASFRSPCYVNSVVTVFFTLGYSIVSTCVFAIIACPMAFAAHVSSVYVYSSPYTDLLFVKIPVIFGVFTYRQIWIAIFYCGNIMLGFRITVIIVNGGLEMITSRNPKLARFISLFSFTAIISIVLIAMPFTSYYGINRFVLSLKKIVNIITVFHALLECFAFVLFYGLDRFYEDIHFKDGIKHKSFTKFVWLAIVCILGFCLYDQIAYHYTHLFKRNLIALVGVGFIIGIHILILLGRVFFALVKKKAMEELKMNSNWGPKSEIVRRSREMFTGQAMTKEYMYRQYHLQAGIQARERASNVRKSQL